METENLMFTNKMNKSNYIPSFEDLSLEEMKALQSDAGVEAEITPTTTSSMMCYSAGIGFLLSATLC